MLTKQKNTKNITACRREDSTRDAPMQTSQAESFKPSAVVLLNSERMGTWQSH
jgi:hypothetical protein